ncbi:hypothetical protein [Bilifractor sp. HCP3S3_D3]|uniref:hypothetical protein n=1 Tax=Bilifractor sp. HCP3S3_D3 TaxID=3438907 RepID=UPI003F8BD9E3
MIKTHQNSSKLIKTKEELVGRRKSRKCENRRLRESSRATEMKKRLKASHEPERPGDGNEEKAEFFA